MSEKYIISLSGGYIENVIESTYDEWPLEKEIVIDQYIYRRVSDTQAVYCGMAKSISVNS